MRLFLLGKQVLYNRYRYFISFTMILLVVCLFGFVSQKQYIRLMMSILLVGHAFFYPLVGCKQQYDKLCVDHLSSFPFKRCEVLGVYMILGYLFGLLAIAITAALGDYVFPVFIVYTFYYSFCMLCYTVCGHALFYGITCILFGTIGIIGWFIADELLSAYVTHFSSIYPSDDLQVVLFPLMLLWRNPNAWVYRVLIITIFIFMLLTIILNAKKQHERIGDAVAFKFVGDFIAVIATTYISAILLVLFSRKEFSLAWLIQYMITFVVAGFMVTLAYKRKMLLTLTMKLGLISACVGIGIGYLSVQALNHYIPTDYKAVSLRLINDNTIMAERGDGQMDTISKIQTLVTNENEHSGKYSYIYFDHNYEQFTLSTYYEINQHSWEEMITLLSQNDDTYKQLMNEEYDFIQLISDNKVTNIEYNSVFYPLNSNELKSLANIVSKAITDVRYTKELSEIKELSNDSVAFYNDVQEEYHIFTSPLIVEASMELLQSKGIIVE